MTGDDRGLVEVEVLQGLVPFVVDEIGAHAPATQVLGTDDTSVRLSMPRSAWPALAGLRTAVAAYAVVGFAVPGPVGLLDEAALDRVVAMIGSIGEQLEPLAKAPGKQRRPEGFAGFRLSAAGRGSDVFRRFTAELSARAGLVHDPDEGELVVRVRKARFAASGWEVLLRLTRRPLSARAWRRENYPGALNATVAAAMVELSEPNATDRVANPMCGSGTLVIERLAVGPVAEMAAWDHAPAALEATRQNLRGARVRSHVALAEADVTDLRNEVPEARFDRLLVDLPWGTLVGSHEDNARLYPAFLREAARITVPGGLLVAVTHEVRLFDRVRHASADWEAQRQVRVFQKGHHPRIHVLRRR